MRPASGKRDSGSFDSADFTIATSSCGTSGRSSSIGGYSRGPRRAGTSRTRSAGERITPAIIVSTVPSEKRSLRASTLPPDACSGRHVNSYYVPWSRCRRVFSSVSLERAARLAMPKSVTSSPSPSSDRRTFCGETSRWTMFSGWFARRGAGAAWSNPFPGHLRRDVDRHPMGIGVCARRHPREERGEVKPIHVLHRHVGRRAWAFRR